MTTPLIQIDDEIREMNESELADYQLVIDGEKAREAQKEAKAIEKAALLERLGITAEEASLLIQ
jgi:hypothetical protein